MSSMQANIKRLIIWMVVFETGFAAQQNCSANIPDFGTCFYDESSGRFWQDRLIELTPAASNGTTDNCIGYRVNQVETRSCDVKEDTIPDYQSSNCINSAYWYRCSNGRCIDTALQCNGDDDCGDASDEYPAVNRASYNCTNRGNFICGIEVTTTTSNTPPKSDRYFLGIPGINKFAFGFDILSGKQRSDVLSMRPHGSCRRILKSGETDYYYRLPHNVNALTQLFTVEEAPGRVAATAAELITQNQYLLQNDYSFGGYLSLNDSTVGFSQAQKMKTFSLQNIASSNRYVAVTSQNQVKIFKVELKTSKNLEVSNSFLERLYGLPRNKFSYDKYLSFITDFGTHYVSSGILGGEYRQTNFYDRCWVSTDLESNLDLTRQKWEERLVFCDRQNINTKLNPALEVPSVCKIGGTTSTPAVNIEDNVVQRTVEVSGGSVSTATKLQDYLSSDTWQAWADTVADSPSMMTDEFELTRISRLLDNPLPIFANEDRLKIQQHLDRAINIYLQPYNTDSYCECKETCGDVESTYAAYLTGSSGQEYSCFCACDDEPPFSVCSGSQIFISYILLMISVLLGWSMA